MSRYTVYVTPRGWKEIKNLPENMRQRVRRAIEALADNITLMILDADNGLIPVLGQDLIGGTSAPPPSEEEPLGPVAP